MAQRLGALLEGSDQRRGVLLLQADAVGHRQWQRRKRCQVVSSIHERPMRRQKRPINALQARSLAIFISCCAVPTVMQGCAAWGLEHFVHPVAAPACAPGPFAPATPDRRDRTTLRLALIRVYCCGEES
jgi:hypothetical protein